MSKAMKTNENRDYLKTSQTTWRQTASTLLYLASRLPASLSRAHLLGLSKGSQESGSSDQFDHLGQGLPRLAEPWHLLPCMSMHVSNVSFELFWRTHKQCKCAEPWVTCVISQWRSKGLYSTPASLRLLLSCLRPWCVLEFETFSQHFVEVQLDFNRHTR